MYQHADQSWRQQPKLISRDTIRAVAYRLEEHARTMRSQSLLVIAHGGEPLLHPDLDFFFGEISRSVKSRHVGFALQTNGTLLTSDKISILQKYNVGVGFSVDGTRETHDRIRVLHSGEGSYDKVVQGLNLMRNSAPELVGSILSVINPRTNPTEILDAIESLGVERGDFLLPELNHDTMGNSGIQAGETGTWLIKLFNAWSEREGSIYIRTFLLLIDLLLGGQRGTDQFGAHTVGALAIETDGSYHIADALKTTFEGASRTGMSVFDSPVRSVEQLPLARSFRDKGSGACEECIRCEYFPVCGGGSPINRYSSSLGFAQPSVYCTDLKLLIGHIRDYLARVRPDCKLTI
jgi:uncharacterized protein